MLSNQATPSADLQATLDKCQQLLSQHYGERLRSLIVFGSAVRNELTPTSDVDLLVLLAPPINYFQELRAVVDLLYPLQLEAPYWISAKPADATEFEQGVSHFYRNILREGIVL
ncbi:MAG: hypothetical protein OHK0037_16790 [Elainellaceae cyanobacterium]